jgi:hypothetical protein
MRNEYNYNNCNGIVEESAIMKNKFSSIALNISANTCNHKKDFQGEEFTTTTVLAL